MATLTFQRYLNAIVHTAALSSADMFILSG